MKFLVCLIYLPLLRFVYSKETFKLDLFVERTQTPQGRTIISINNSTDMFGPEIHVSQGQKVSINVHNNICSLEEYEQATPLFKEYCETTLHFHGLIPLSNNLDGVPNLTQTPIKPCENFTYLFEIPKEACGTYWYHSHSSVQYGDGLRGIFKVKCPELEHLNSKVLKVLDGLYYHPNDGILDLSEDLLEGDVPTQFVQEHTITFSDYYEDWNFNILKTKVMSHKGIPDPRVENSLINGNKEDNVILKINPETKYLLLRIINTGMSGTQIFHIPNNNFVITEVDGVLIKPITQETLTIAVGQRYSILVKLNKEKVIPMINGCGKMMGYIKKVLWMVREDPSSLVDPKSFPPYPSIKIKNLPSLIKTERYKEFQPHPNSNITYFSEYDETIVLDYEYSREINKEQGTRMYLINKKSLSEYLQNPKKVYYREDKSKCLQIIVNSLDHMRHPWHLHGFNFQVVSIGNKGDGPLYLDKIYTPAYRNYIEDIQFWNATQQVPMTRDSINIPGNSYVVIRFIPNRQGSWLFHCHIEWHMEKGLGYAFQIIEDSSNKIASSTLNMSNNDIIIREKIKVITIYSIIMVLFNAIIYFIFCS